MTPIFRGIVRWAQDHVALAMLVAVSGGVAIATIIVALPGCVEDADAKVDSASADTSQQQVLVDSQTESQSHRIQHVHQRGHDGRPPQQQAAQIGPRLFMPARPRAGHYWPRACPSQTVMDAPGHLLPQAQVALEVVAHLVMDRP